MPGLEPSPLRSAAHPGRRPPLRPREPLPARRRPPGGGAPRASPKAMSVPDGAEAVDDRMDASARLARLNEAMSRLPPHLKAPLMLTAIEGRSQAETAGMLGVSIKTVETRVARARRKLSEALDDTPAVRAALE